MADVFEWKRGLSTWRSRLWQLIEETPNLDWLLLTKRPHLGVGSCLGAASGQPTFGSAQPSRISWADKRLPHLAETGASVRFLSCEPLLGRVDLNHWLKTSAVHWVIAGGESGPHGAAE